MTAYNPRQAKGSDPLAMTSEELAHIYSEIEEQPAWRSRADREMDYADGNQLDSELLRRQQELGIPPAIEDLVGPALLAIQGYERSTRQDWRVTPNGQPGGQDVADALNFKLNEAERLSKADDACSDAFRPQIGVGIGWVEVSRESDPFKYPYRCKAVHRNEIRWSMVSTTEADLSDCPWLHRERWLRPERLALVFPQHRELIELCGKHGGGWYSAVAQQEGGVSTGLSNAWGEAASQTILEQHWYNASTKELALAEVWYRRWVSVPVLRTPDGRVVEFDEKNPAHTYAAATGVSKITLSTVSRVRRSFWLGPHCLHDGPSPYPHSHFPYVPFWGFREDGSGVPYGYVRAMIFQQDSLNSGISKLRWGMSSVRVTNTKGAVDMSSSQLRKMVARVDAHIELNADHMAQPGAKFEIERDFQLNAQQMEMLQMARAAIERIGPASTSFQGRQGNATSGRQEEAQIEQANQSLGHIMGMFKRGRTQVGELLLAMIVEDMGDQEQTVVIEGDAITPNRAVVINKPEQDPAGYTYLSNDLQRTRLMVSLEDVPSSASYRGQQLNALSETIKSLPPEYQAAAMPFLTSLMDLPFKRQMIEAFKAVQTQQTPEQIEQRVNEAVQQALAKSGHELKARELDLKSAKNEAEIKKIMAEAVQVGVQAAFSAMQAGAQVAQMPMIAPIADQVMKGAGYVRPNPMGDDPNFPTPETAAAMQMRDPYTQGQGRPDDAAPLAEVQNNTSPGFPPVPQQGGSAMSGIETPTTTDNLEGAPA